MTDATIRFEDGAAYERAMGVWSRIAGEIFLDWLAPPRGLRWIDIGCGNGAFTELLVERCRPADIQGVDPSDAQLDFARARPATKMVGYHQGDAMALPFPAGRFDAAVMALAITFVPDTAKGVQEMARVVGRDGIVATYNWDMVDGGFPLDPMLEEMRAMGLKPPRPPRMEVSRLDTLRGLWNDAGLEGVETRVIDVTRTFADFDDYWISNARSVSLGPLIATLTEQDRAALESRVRARLPADAQGRITCGARAHAVKGRRR